MITLLTLLIAIPTGILLSKLTKDEKQIYSKSPYFPIFFWILLILSSIFLTINKTIAMTLLFILIMIYTWNKS